jgi:mannitol-1-phosphate/altronate dehydrogenase
MKEDDMAKLNPLISKVTIGTREMREIKIYPLSLADQLELSQIFVKTIQEIVSEGAENNFQFADAVRKAITENIGKVLSLITEEGEKLLKEITNPQALEIAEIVYDSNYGILEKKVKSLVEKIRQTFHLEASSPVSSDNIPSTDLKTSLGEDSKKGDLPSDK